MLGIWSERNQSDASLSFSAEDTYCCTPRQRIQHFKLIKKNYRDWLHGDHSPTFSHTLFKDFVIPNLNPQQGLLWVVIDNLRYDQYRILEPLINQHYKKEQEHPYFSILPTATQYARNAIFSGMMPSEMEKNYPNYWKS